MENFIKNLKISNFKSIREAELECGRVNLFVGKPNVGKSNVLEALSLLNFKSSNGEKFMSEFIRYEKPSNLFYFQNRDEIIHVSADDWNVNVHFRGDYDEYSFYYRVPSRESLKRESNFEIVDISIDKSGVIKSRENGPFKSCPIRLYLYSENTAINTSGNSYLNPPHGNNLFWVLQTNKRLKDAIPGMFSEYGLEFLIDLEETKIAVQRKENGIFYKIPYQLVASTLKRIIFHYAAIFSNKDSVILFEEPEAHSFPPYVRELALKISESLDNQYFITTHSPHLFTTLVEETPVEELAVFITYFENYETKFKKLNAEEICELLDYGIDIFFNQRWFLNEGISENPA